VPFSRKGGGVSQSGEEKNDCGGGRDETVRGQLGEKAAGSSTEREGEGVPFSRKAGASRSQERRRATAAGAGTKR
jgi:hypothetical protein